VEGDGEQQPGSAPRHDSSEPVGRQSQTPIESFEPLREGIFIYHLLSVRCKARKRPRLLQSKVSAVLSFNVLLGSLILVKVLDDGRDGDLCVEVALWLEVRSLAAEA